MKYTDILNDEIIQNKYTKIDTNNESKVNHGKKHAENVINNVIKLANILNVDEIEKNYLCIACVLHDIGQLTGSKDHYLRSKDFAKEYLQNKINKTWYDKILSAIEKHHEKEHIDDLSLFEHLVLFADKTDFTYKRVDSKYKEDCFERHIKDINFEIENNIFKILITSDASITMDDFIKWDYYPKIIKRIQEFSHKINKDYKIEFI